MSIKAKQTTRNTIMSTFPGVGKKRKENSHYKRIGDAENESHQEKDLVRWSPTLGSKLSLSHQRNLHSLPGWKPPVIMFKHYQDHFNCRWPSLTRRWSLLSPVKLGFVMSSEQQQRVFNSVSRTTFSYIPPFMLSGRQVLHVSAESQLLSMSGRKHHFNCRVQLPKTRRK